MITSKFSEKFWMWLSFRMPKKLVYFCAIRLGAFATQGKYSDSTGGKRSDIEVPELRLMDAVKSYGAELTWR